MANGDRLMDDGVHAGWPPHMLDGGGDRDQADHNHDSRGGLDG
jgi:hypothetical protein